MTRPADISGKRYGRLIVQSYDASVSKWLCLCDCGQTTLKKTGHLNSGYAVTCGCSLRFEGRSSHGLSRAPEYKAWDNARSRCYREKDRKFPLYGGRGIRMCDRWKNSFEAFIADMGRRPDGGTLDRIDSNGHYEPENCRWATYTEQNRNRPSYNRFVRLHGRRITIGEAAEKLGIPHATILGRLEAGYSEDDACRGR